MQGEIQAVTSENRHAAVELLARFFREEGFAAPPSRIAENPTECSPIPPVHGSALGSR